MLTKNDLLRKKLVRLIGFTALIGVLSAIWCFAPAFQSANYEIRDNQLIVKRNNKYNTNMDVALIIIDEEYFKDILETEDDVYIVEVEEELYNFTSKVIVIATIM